MWELRSHPRGRVTSIPVATNGATSALDTPWPLASPNRLDPVPGPTTRHALLAVGEDLQRRLQALALDVDGFWRASLEGEDFRLVTSSVEASHAVHRAIAALDIDRYVIGGRTGGPRP